MGSGPYPQAAGSVIAAGHFKGARDHETSAVRPVLPIAIAATPAAAQGKYPPLSDYLMPLEAEIALARSAAPPVVSDGATVKVLTASGFEVARQGDNGAVCLVMRGFSAPTYTPAAFRGIVY